MNLVNLTPHSITIKMSNGEMLTIPPTGIPARCRVESTYAYEVLPANAPETTIVCSRAKYGAVYGLPDEAEDTIFIVSMVVREACPQRADLASPGVLIRDTDGNIVGCDGLTVN